MPRRDTPRSVDGARTQTRRGFLRSAGLGILGAAAAVGLPAAMPAAPAASGRTVTDALAGARRLSYRAVAETVAGLRGSDRGSDVTTAEERIVAWYAKATTAERTEIDAALDAVTEVLGAVGRSSRETRDRAVRLAEHLTGPQERPLTSAIGLAVSGLAGEQSRPVDAYSAGRLYARLIRVLPEQRGPGRMRGPERAGNKSVPCLQQAS
ncbi:hypothetical protein [Actinomadura chokoriensis]|uniref:hypothetical protein n=1 Tax=Actinomadura chokoriensis TaxID=454156 RepID=UPI0031F8A89A